MSSLQKTNTGQLNIRQSERLSYNILDRELSMHAHRQPTKCKPGPNVACYGKIFMPPMCYDGILTPNPKKQPEPPPSV